MAATRTPRFQSTRGGVSGLGFEQAVFEGLARDGGLLVPDFVPDVSEKWKSWASLPFHELAFEIVSLYCPPEEIPSEDLRDLMKRSYGTFQHPEVVPNVKAGDFHFMELFHGVSFSFKDVALQGLGNLYEYFLKRNKRQLTIVCATSGDTGSAAIHGLRGKENIDCFVLFPEGRVSPVQQNQMTSVLDPNVHCMALEGTFDDCQNMVKSLFSDLALKEEYGLGAVNSINWARIMLQITYYFYTYYKFFPECDGTASFTVPTGNFGDILAGYYAKRMGLPVRNLVVATNANDILHRFFTQGEYDMGTVHATTSPSMDIQISSNFERYLYYLFNQDAARLKQMMLDFKSTGKLHVSEELRQRALLDFDSASASNAQVADAIKSYCDEHDYMLCPHTACGAVAAEQVRDKLQWQSTPKHVAVVLATAHPGKFPDAVTPAAGKPPSMPPALAAAQTAETRLERVPNIEQVVREAIKKYVKPSGSKVCPELELTDSAAALVAEPASASDLAADDTPTPVFDLAAGEALENLFQQAISEGLATEASVSLMREHLASGKFTEEHYVRMWENRLAAESSKPVQPETLEAQVSFVRQLSAWATNPSSPKKHESLDSLFKEAVAQGLTSEAAVDHMLMNLEAGTFTEEYYRSMWQGRLDAHDKVVAKQEQPQSPRLMTAAASANSPSTVDKPQAVLDQVLSRLAEFASCFCNA